MVRVVVRREGGDTLVYGHVAAVAINNLIVVIVGVNVAAHRAEVLRLLGVFARVSILSSPHHRAPVPRHRSPVLLSSSPSPVRLRAAFSRARVDAVLFCRGGEGVRRGLLAEVWGGVGMLGGEGVGEGGLVWEVVEHLWLLL